MANDAGPGPAYSTGVNYPLPASTKEYAHLEEQSVCFADLMGCTSHSPQPASPSLLVDVGCGTGVVTTHFGNIQGDIHALSQLDPRLTPGTADLAFGRLLARVRHPRLAGVRGRDARPRAPGGLLRVPGPASNNLRGEGIGDRQRLDSSSESQTPDHSTKSSRHESSDPRLPRSSNGSPVHDDYFRSGFATNTHNPGHYVHLTLSPQLDPLQYPYPIFPPSGYGAKTSTLNTQSVTRPGVASIIETAGNADCFIIILCGGRTGPNYQPWHIVEAKSKLRAQGFPCGVVVDCSHGNSQKKHQNQFHVAAALAELIAGGARAVIAVMMESNIHEGDQKDTHEGKAGLRYGVSITDACTGWEKTEEVLGLLANAVKTRRDLFSS